MFTSMKHIGDAFVWKNVKQTEIITPLLSFSHPSTFALTSLFIHSLFFFSLSLIFPFTCLFAYSVFVSHSFCLFPLLFFYAFPFSSSSCSLFWQLQGSVIGEQFTFATDEFDRIQLQHPKVEIVSWESIKQYASLSIRRQVMVSARFQFCKRELEHRIKHSCVNLDLVVRLNVLLTFVTDDESCFDVKFEIMTF